MPGARINNAVSTVSRLVTGAGPNPVLGSPRVRGWSCNGLDFVAIECEWSPFCFPFAFFSPRSTLLSSFFASSSSSPSANGWGELNPPGDIAFRMRTKRTTGIGRKANMTKKTMPTNRTFRSMERMCGSVVKKVWITVVITVVAHACRCE